MLARAVLRGLVTLLVTPFVAVNWSRAWWCRWRSERAWSTIQLDNFANIW